MSELVKTQWGFFCPDWCNDAPPRGEAHTGMKEAPEDFSKVVHYGSTAGWTFMEWPKPEGPAWDGLHLTIDLVARSDEAGHPTRPFLIVDESWEIHDPNRAALLAERLASIAAQLLAMVRQMKESSPPPEGDVTKQQPVLVSRA